MREKLKADIESPWDDELLPRAYNTGHFGFTDNEIVSLRCALEFCVRKSLLVIEASFTAFANFTDAFE